MRLVVIRSRKNIRSSRTFIWNNLEAFGFHEIVFLKYLYSDIESKIKINGGLCAPCKVTRGIRLSGMLYSLAIKPLLQQIRKSLDGLRVPHCDFIFCLPAYADDLIILFNKQREIQVLSNLIEDFGRWSSAKVNWEFY